MNNWMRWWQQSPRRLAISRHFFCWLILGILGFTVVTACNHDPSPNVSSSSNLSTAECRIIKHSMGKTCVPINPQRVVTFNVPNLGNALALGVKPVGSTDTSYLSEDTYLAGKIDSVRSLGNNSSPNLETISLIKPDVMIGWSGGLNQVYPLLSEIAPTVLFDYDYQAGKTWRDTFDFVTQVLGKQEAAPQAWKHYDRRVENLKAALGDRYKDKEISLVFFAPDVMFSEGTNSFADTILKDVGLQRPEAQNATSFNTEIYFSLEELGKADGDIMFVGTLSDDAQKSLEELKQKPLWKNLRAVRQNRVYPIDYMAWRGDNLLAADVVIDDLYKYLVDIPSSSANPAITPQSDKPNGMAPLRATD